MARVVAGTLEVTAIVLTPFACRLVRLHRATLPGQKEEDEE